MNNFKTLIDIFHLDNNEIFFDPIIVDDDKSIEINVELKVPKIRICPHCNSQNVIIKDKKTTRHPYSIVFNSDKAIYINITKRKFKCKICQKQFTQSNSLVDINHQIPYELCRIIYNKTKELLTFEQIASMLNISRNSVISIFDDMVKIGRQPLSTSISLDEKKFTTFDGKYITVISNSLTGKIIDILPSRKKEYLRNYFSKIPINERAKVQFFTSDMYDGFKFVHDSFFPNSIHIIDNFHVTKLFTDKIQYYRKEYMKTLSKSSVEYVFLKSKWKLFIINPCSEKYKDTIESYRVTKKGEFKSFKTELQKVFYKCPKLLEIYNLYYDYCNYMKRNLDEQTLHANLNYIIDKSYSSFESLIQKLGDTLIQFENEIVNSFSTINKYCVSNAIAEANNNKISKLISVSNGYRNFKRFRKRVLHMDTKKRG